jgi:hypothetical protein
MASGSAFGPGVTSPGVGVFVHDPAGVGETGGFVHWAFAVMVIRAMIGIMIFNII